ncbi:MAG: hemerythrin domain-containing protein [Dehalococcoidia bacterium]|nr:hemerythrin domain-containing protein [Dehalococcoidia bacterium]
MPGSSRDDITFEPLASLVREHELIQDAVSRAREAVEEAVHTPADAALKEAGLAQLRALLQFMEVDLAAHIAKEEESLFPALRGFDAATDTVVDELLEQHDRVRERRALLQRALDHIDAGHDEVRDEQEQLAAALAAATESDPGDLMTGLWELVRRLDWILQGHFGDEEDDLFLPAQTLLGASVFARLTAEMAAIDARTAAARR